MFCIIRVQKTGDLAGIIDQAKECLCNFGVILCILFPKSREKERKDRSSP